MSGSNFFDPLSSTLSIALTDENGLAMLAKCTGAPPTTAGIFQHGCFIIRTDSGTGVAANYINTGSTASPDWNLIDSTADRTQTISLPFKVPAPTGSNQSLGSKCLFKCSQALTIVSVGIASDVATTGSDATNNYNFLPVNLTAAANLHTSATTTQASELSITNLKTITVSQNLSFTGNQVFGITVNIADDGSAGPTNLSAAQLYAIVEFTI